jgi:nitrous oxide reductase
MIADDHGYNDSISHGAPTNPWPIVSVHIGDWVNLTFCNLDSVEAHGFAIDIYFDRGVILSPGTAYQVSFRAFQAGSFRIFCTNFCTVHKYMSGKLVVS